MSSKSLAHNSSQRQSRIKATYQYHDEDGGLLFEVVRFEPKDFRQRKPDGNGGWVWKLDKVRRVPYRLPELMKADPSRTVFVVEGEKDVENLAALGGVATTCPQGAGKWDKLDTAAVRKGLAGRRVVVVEDNDDSGRAHAEDVANRLDAIALEVRKLTLPGLPEKGDLSDWLASGGTYDRLLELAAEAPRWEPKGANQTGDRGSDHLWKNQGNSPKVVKLVARTADAIDAAPVDWLWPSRIPLGMISIIDGDPGLGKSLISVALTTAVTTGRAGVVPGQLSFDPAGVLILAAEDDAARVIRPRLDEAGADLSRCHIIEEVDAGGFSRSVIMPDDLEMLEQYVKDHGIKLVIIDPLMSYLGDRIDSHKDQSIRRVMYRIRLLAERTEAAVVIIRHLNKKAGESALYRGGGSIAISGAARSAMVVGKVPDGNGAFGLAVAKCNLSARPRTLTYTVELGKRQPHIVWGGETDHTADDLLPAQTGAVRGESRDHASEWLTDQLKNGPVSAKDITDRAEDAGIAEKTLYRAKEQLKVESAKEGFGGSWVWSLPRSGSSDHLREKALESPKMVTSTVPSAPDLDALWN